MRVSSTVNSLCHVFPCQPGATVPPLRRLPGCAKSRGRVARPATAEEPHHPPLATESRHPGSWRSVASRARSHGRHATPPTGPRLPHVPHARLQRRPVLAWLPRLQTAAATLRRRAVPAGPLSARHLAGHGVKVQPRRLAFAAPRENTRICV